jgi:hypothetical protein
MTVNSDALPTDRALTDRDRLRRFEPVIRYTRGERFFPMSVESYVRECSLWVQRPGEEPDCLVPEGELTLAKLAEPRADGFRAVYFLKFIEAVNIADLAAYLFEKRRPLEVFHPGRGRLARVGYGSRFVDALFSLTLLARGRVPGDTAAAAAITYKRILSQYEHYCYYGRVVRENNWVILQYWFFYPFNNWRSDFFGVNDHEADWEMINLYLSELPSGEVRPEWVAYASHDYVGDDLRRRWDDPEVEKVGEHPVIYAGAGSHASYFQPGEYLAELELPFLARLQRGVNIARSIWRRVLGQTRDGSTEREINVFRVPFVDYARGDGPSIGPGQDRAWDEPQLLDPVPAWAFEYRGLWGVYVQDPIAGENAPAGPLYNRDGRMRRAWYDPLGWAGLNKLPPPIHEQARVQQRIDEIRLRHTSLEGTLAEKSDELMDLGVEDLAMEGRPHLRKQHDVHRARIAQLSTEIAELRAQIAEDGALLEALELHAEELARGERGYPRAHIKRAHLPTTDVGLRLSRIAEAWSAISIGMLMVSFVLMVLFAPGYILPGLAIVISAIIFIEAGFRQQLTRLVTSVTVGLALVCALILLFEFFWQVVITAVLIAGGYIMWENLNELRH